MLVARHLLFVVMVVTMTPTLIYCQHLGSARGTSISAFTAVARDGGSLDWNPAGILGIREWELSITNFLTTGVDKSTLSFHSVTAGRKFGAHHALAVRVSPGISKEFTVPSTVIIKDSSASLVSSFDKRIAYNERFSAAYAFSPHVHVSLGIAAHYYQEQITDTKYEVDSNFIIRSGIVDVPGSSWSLDWGLQWFPSNDISIGIVASNLFHIVEERLSGENERDGLEYPKIVSAGIAYYATSSLMLAIEGDTERHVRGGLEWTLIPEIVVRAGTYIDASSSFTADALSAGLGGSLGPLQLDLSYLRFVARDGRGGSAEYALFASERVSNLEFNAFTNDRIALSAQLAIGRKRESLARIEYVEMISDIYSASQVVYAFRPIGRARVRNVSGQPLEAKVSFFVEGLMDAPTETKAYYIVPDEQIEIPFSAVFNNAVQAMTALVVKGADVTVRAHPHEEYDDKYQTRVLFRGRNDWNGDMAMLRYFVTSDDPEILRFSRRALSAAKTHLDTVHIQLLALEQAKVIIDEIAGVVRYVSDPRRSQDYVQYPRETLALHGGDCEDLTVCISALLSSIGIKTAFVDVVPPTNPEASHVYMMFDTGIDAAGAVTVSDNPKRYVLRQDHTGRETVWIPIESTVSQKGFERAWNTGAAQYFQNAELELGLAKGWLRIIDID